MGLKRVITDRWRRLAGADADAPGSTTTPVASEVIALWREVVSDRRAAGEDLGETTDLTALEARVAAGDERGDPALVAELLASIRELTLPCMAQQRARIDELSGGSRSHQRAAASHQLKLTHLQDEIARCRDLIEQECRRRGLALSSPPLAADNLHDLLYRVFTAISHAGSRRMQAAGFDPIIGEIERLIAAEDPAAVEAFPAWLRQPAARVVALVQERNRYKRLLINQGLLPAE